MDLSPEVRTLFRRMIDLDEVQRSRYFEDHPIDPAVRTQLEELLACDSNTDSDLCLPVQIQVRALLNDAARNSCGPYRLVRKLGEGGMGEVWLAERNDHILKRPVALKLPHAGIHAVRFAERTKRERDILASLTHAGIARLYDAGLTEDGRPFLALEFIEGADLVSYSNQHRLSIRNRIALFLQVLHAVQYAHSRLVIHRDLKPSNILVTKDGEVKLLDFGIAKLVNPSDRPDTAFTVLGERPFTLQYASPEQVSGNQATTASDIFSLGVLLFELLSGSLPFLPKRNSQAALEEAIVSFEPRRLSQAVAGENHAQSCSTGAKNLKSQLKGDLEQIVLKALQKDPERRYATVDAFRSDIERFLSGEAVLAHPESARYRARKFIFRHKLPVAAAASVFFALAGGLGVALWQANVARNEARTSAAVQEFTEDIFRANEIAHPDPVKARQTTARELLDMGANKIQTNLDSAPEAKLRMLKFLGGLYLDLSLDDQAVSLQKQRLALARRQYGSSNPALIPSMIGLASAMHASHSVKEREAVLLEGKAILDKAGDFGSLTRASLLCALAAEYSSTDLRKALAFSQESVALYRRRPPSVELGNALYEEGLALQFSGDFSKAERAFAENISLSKKFEGDPNSFLPRAYAFEAEAQAEQMHFSEAEQNFRKGLSAALIFQGSGSIDTIETESRLGSLLVRMSRPREGLTYLRQAKDTCIRLKGAGDPFYTPQMLLQYGMALYIVGQPEQALEAVSQAVENRRRNRPGTRYLGQMLEDQAAIFIELGGLREAGDNLAEAASIRAKVGVSEMDENYLTPRINLVLASNRPDEAAALVDHYYGRVPDSLQPSYPVLNNLRARAQIALLRRDAKTALAMADDILAATSANPFSSYLASRRFQAMLFRGEALLLNHNPSAALPILESALQGELQINDPASPQLSVAEALLGTACLDSGNRIAASQHLVRARSILAVHAHLGPQYRRAFDPLKTRLSAAR